MTITNGSNSACYSDRLLERAAESDQTHLDELMELLDEIEDIESPRKEQLLVEGILALEAERRALLPRGGMHRGASQPLEHLPSGRAERLAMKWVA